MWSLREYNSHRAEETLIWGYRQIGGTALSSRWDPLLGGIMRLLHTSVLVLAVTACATGRYQLSVAEEETAKQALLATLNDSNSAKLGRATGTKNIDGSVLVCINVDTKNSSGSYVGKAPAYIKLVQGRVSGPPTIMNSQPLCPD